MYLAHTVLPAPDSPLEIEFCSEENDRMHAPDDDALVLVVDEHVPVHVVGERVDVRRVLVGRRALVLLHLALREVGHLLERVHRDEHRPDVRLEKRGKFWKPKKTKLSKGKLTNMTLLL